MELSNSYPSLAGAGVFITGGASGIGAVLVAQFARQGARVALVDIDAEAAAALCDHVAEQGYVRPWFQPVDVTDIAALRRALDQGAAALGGVKVLINNAARDDRHAFETLEPADWDGAMNVNLRPHFFAMQRAATVMGAGGSMINMGSVSWMRRRPGMVAYTTAKGAIMALTRTMAQELGGRGIRVNCIVPGAILTERQQKLWLTPALNQSFLDDQALKFRLEAEDIAAMALFLASDDARGCSGQSFIVDGGIV